MSALILSSLVLCVLIGVTEHTGQQCRCHDTHPGPACLSTCASSRVQSSAGGIMTMVLSRRPPDEATRVFADHRGPPSHGPARVESRGAAQYGFFGLMPLSPCRRLEPRWR
jgi:hypothetical protein